MDRVLHYFPWLNQFVPREFLNCFDLCFGLFKECVLRTWLRNIFEKLYLRWGGKQLLRFVCPWTGHLVIYIVYILFTFRLAVDRPRSIRQAHQQFHTTNNDWQPLCHILAVSFPTRPYNCCTGFFFYFSSSVTHVQCFLFISSSWQITKKNYELVEWAKQKINKTNTKNTKKQKHEQYLSLILPPQANKFIRLLSVCNMFVCFVSLRWSLFCYWFQ